MCAGIYRPSGVSKQQAKTKFLRNLASRGYTKTQASILWNEEEENPKKLDLRSISTARKYKLLTKDGKSRKLKPIRSGKAAGGEGYLAGGKGYLAGGKSLKATLNAVIKKAVEQQLKKAITSTIRKPIRRTVKKTVRKPFRKSTTVKRKPAAKRTTKRKVGRPKKTVRRTKRAAGVLVV